MNYLDWHVGMKVVCIADASEWVNQTVNLPQRGMVYTIRTIESDNLEVFIRLSTRRFSWVLSQTFAARPSEKSEAVMTRILVCGGRDYADGERVWRELDEWQTRHGRLVIIQGGARGADEHARTWAYHQSSVHLINEPADWKKHGKAAGPIRNQIMLDEHRPEWVLAFPGGNGTADMIHRAEKAGVKVVRIVP